MSNAGNEQYELDGTADAFQCPEKRERGAIKRSRGDAVRDRHFSKTNNAELINFCEGTGARRTVLEKMTGDDYWTRDRMKAKMEELSAMDESTLNKKEKALKRALEDALKVYSESDIAAVNEMQDFVLHRRDKGGKYRFSPIIGPHKDDIIRRFKETQHREEETGKPEKVWQHVHTCCDCHGYRGTYAKTLYKMCARNIEDIPYDKYHAGIHRKVQSDVYSCRKEEAGRKFDKRALRVCTKAVGHNRLNVIVDNYLYGL